MHRRQFLTTASLAGLAVAAAPRVVSAAGQSGTMTLPTAQRFKIGDISVTAFGDGALHIGPDALSGVDAEEYAELMKQSFRDPETYPTSVNAFLVETGDMTIMIDSGAGKAMGDAMGNLPENLKAVGVDPAAVTHLVATHLHPDHIGGAAPNGEAAFPEAELVVNETERAFWSDDSNFAGAGEQAQSFMKVAQGALSAYGDRTRTVEGEAEVAPGITAVPLHGHTPGHSGYMISSGGESLLLWGDIVHVPPVQLARPDVTISFDVDPDAAAKTRKAILDRAASERLMVAGSHMGFPGLANIEKAGEGYRAVDADWDYGA